LAKNSVTYFMDGPQARQRRPKATLHVHVGGDQNASYQYLVRPKSKAYSLRQRDCLNLKAEA